VWSWDSSAAKIFAGRHSALLAVGADLIGDVQVLPHGELPTETSPAVRVSAFADVDFADLSKRTLGDRLDRVGIPGIQGEVSAQMVTLPVEQAGDRFILKLNPDSAPPRHLTCSG
jgi:serine/threonine-protein kinase HipA